MELARIIGSNYPYILNVPVLESGAIAEGEMMMRHATWNSENTKYYISAYTSDNVEAEDTVGITQTSAVKAAAHKENAALYAIGSDGLPNATIAEGGNFLPCVVNPEATYFAFYDQTVAKSCTTVISASTTWTITSLEDNIQGGWLFTTDDTDANATYPGLLEYVEESPAAGSATMAVAVTVDTNTDFVKVLPIGHRLTGLNAAATGMTTAIAAETGVYLDILENWVSHSGSPKVRLRFWNHKGLRNLTQLKVDAELVQLRHCWNATVDGT